MTCKCKKEEFIDKNIKKQIFKNLRYISNSKELKNIKKSNCNCLCNYEYFKKIYLYYAENIENLILKNIITPNKEYFKKLLTIITFTDDNNIYIYKNSFRIVNGNINKTVCFENIQEDFIKIKFKNYINDKNTAYPIAMKNSLKCSNNKKSKCWVGYNDKKRNTLSYSLYTNSNTSVSYTATTTSKVAWSGGSINGTFLWAGNFVGSSPISQYYANNVSAAQTFNNTTTSNIVSTTGTYTYSDQIPTGEGINAVWLFSGYSNASSALNSFTNYTTGSNGYTVASNYLVGTGLPYLLGITFGGGSQSTGSWDTGSSGAIYSIYEAVTQSGVSFSYTETGTGNTLSGTGTGTLNNSFNSILFDIETYTSGSTASSGTDFLNLFNYIKSDSKSTFYNNGSPYECIIIVSTAHSCAYLNGTGNAILQPIMEDQDGYYDYFQPQMYTENVGITNEYTSNYQITWPTWITYLQNNYNYNQVYGQGFILPALYFNTLLYNGGNNDGLPPNLYWYQSSDTSTTPAVYTYSGTTSITYSSDLGCEDFFNTQTDVSATLGGSMQWVNGTLS
mgnify:CR=1 FL=1